ncbi:MAG: hypothetical protein IIT61_03295 [Bacteroidales bacterium]|nr:hypothetical protein [Bacteroidales bacterium]MBQ2002641.1 hypothetical protein [Bacteroidaceae bacterium]MBQ2351518.1 hypothetical protein [Bacteroidales bacterium]MBQ2573973.1 hypothetical protein [Bacteroidales bacterium]MBQ5423932.1 hypothetical protein [Bacteroidales bacterium]
MKIRKDKFIYKHYPYYVSLTRRQFKELRIRFESGTYPLTVMCHASKTDGKLQIDHNHFIIQQSQSPNFDVGEIVKVRLCYLMALDERGMCMFVNSGITQGLPVSLWDKLAYMLKPKTAELF